MQPNPHLKSTTQGTLVPVLLTPSQEQTLNDLLEHFRVHAVVNHMGEESFVEASNRAELKKAHHLLLGTSKFPNSWTRDLQYAIAGMTPEGNLFSRILQAAPEGE
jgi:hypothetical protein